MRSASIAEPARGLRTAAERVLGMGLGRPCRGGRPGRWSAPGPGRAPAAALDAAHEQLQHLRRGPGRARTRCAVPGHQPEPPGRGGAAAVHRKERYFTSTVLPAIVTAELFRHLAVFL